MLAEYVEKEELTQLKRDARTAKAKHKLAEKAQKHLAKLAKMKKAQKSTKASKAPKAVVKTPQKNALQIQRVPLALLESEVGTACASFLQHLDNAIAFMKKIDKHCDAILKPFVEIALYMAVS
eukprot:7557199-Pyramimonas_sp.AAC.1